jgi:hypothetical protein
MAVQITASFLSNFRYMNLEIVGSAKRLLLISTIYAPLFKLYFLLVAVNPSSYITYQLTIAFQMCSD